MIGQDVSDELCNYIFQEKYQNFHIIAHNFQSFDRMFISKWLLENGIINEPMLSGGKIKNILVPSLSMYFRDFLAYVATSLPKFPAVVGFTGISKGCFLYKNTLSVKIFSITVDR